MNTEKIVAEVYRQCAEKGKPDMVPVVIRKLANALRKVADECDALVKKELAKKGKGKP